MVVSLIRRSSVLRQTRKPRPEEQTERMVFEAGTGTGMEVAEQAHFQRDAAVENEKRVLLE